MIKTGVDVLHYCCMDDVGWKRLEWKQRVEVGLQIMCCKLIWTYAQQTIGFIMAQYLYIRQRKLSARK